MMFNGHGPTAGWTLIVFAVGLPALFIAAGLILARTRRTPADPVAPDPDAERTLADRFARGEIDTREYQERLRTLRAAGR